MIFKKQHRNTALGSPATLIRVSKSHSAGRMEEMVPDLNIGMTRAEPFEFPAMARSGLALALWRGVAEGVRHRSQIYGPLLFVLE